jgi:hypothetical protein
LLFVDEEERMDRFQVSWLPLMLAIAMCAPMAPALSADSDRIYIAADSHRDRVSKFLQREDVRKELAARGIDPNKVQARVNGLNRQELDRLAREIDRAAPNGEPVLPIFGIALFAFIVLVIADLLGFTRIFPFTRR